MKGVKMRVHHFEGLIRWMLGSTTKLVLIMMVDDSLLAQDKNEWLIFGAESDL